MPIICVDQRLIDRLHSLKSDNVDTLVYFNVNVVVYFAIDIKTHQSSVNSTIYSKTQVWQVIVKYC